jgi:glycerol uptake facilitator-like aquaporin
MVFALRRELPFELALTYLAAQIAGGIIGTFVAHAMFELPIWQISATASRGSAQWLAEVIAAFGLIFPIFAGLRVRGEAIPWLVGLYITAAYWFPASTSFANPAVAIARALFDTFAGIRPIIIAELVGALAGRALAGWMLAEPGFVEAAEDRDGS